MSEQQGQDSNGSDQQTFKGLPNVIKCFHTAGWFFDPTKPNPELAGHILETAGQHDHAFIGEIHPYCGHVFNHQILQNNPEIFSGLIEQGKVHLVLEIPQAYQEPVDRYMQGEIDEDSLRTEMFGSYRNTWDPKWVQGEQDIELFQNSIVETIQSARAAGMHSVLLVDDLAEEGLDVVSWQADPEIESFLKDAYQSYAQTAQDMSFRDYLAEQVVGLPEEDRNRFLSTFEKYSVPEQDRLNDFGEARMIMNRVPDGEGVFGIYGMSHLVNAMDPDAAWLPGLDDLLERFGDSVGVIAIFPHSSALSYFDSEVRREGPNAKILDLPERTITLKEGVVTP